MKFTFFRLLIVVALLWGGGQGLFTALTNRSSAEYGVADYLAKRPDAKWLRLTGGRLDLAEIVFSGGRFTQSIDEVFVPLTAEVGAGEAVAAGTENASEKVRLLVASKDPALLAFAAKLRDAKDEGQVLRLLINPEGVDPNRPVEGLVRFGIDLKDDDARKLRVLNPDLAEDFVIVAEGERPEMGAPVFALCGGLLLGALMLRGGTKSGPPPLAPSAVGRACGVLPPPLPPAR